MINRNKEEPRLSSHDSGISYNLFPDAILITLRFSGIKDERFGSVNSLRLFCETKLCISDFTLFIVTVFGGSNFPAIELKRNREGSTFNKDVYSMSCRRGFVLFVQIRE